MHINVYMVTYLEIYSLFPVVLCGHYNINKTVKGQMIDVWFLYEE